jgi:hypothetical protein
MPEPGTSEDFWRKRIRTVRRMISGLVNALREAVVQTPVRSLDGQEQAIEVVIDPFEADFPP